MGQKLCFYRPARLNFTLSNIYYCLYFVIYILAILDSIFNIKYWCIQIGLLLYKPVYSVYKSGRAWPRWSRSRWSSRRPRSSWCPKPNQTCRYINTHGRTSVRMVVLTTVTTHQLIRARERHERHQKQPPCSARTTFFLQGFVDTWASTLWPVATDNNGDEKNRKSEAQRCAVCCSWAPLP